jgi:hypothetical protein
MVAFVDPRTSKIDIAQAAGRAMRQSKATNKKLGYIVVPLFIEQKKGETEAEAFTRAGFDEVAEVLGAMLESDDDLVDTIEKMQEARGRGDKFNPRQLHEKIQVIGPAINLDELTLSINVEILERLGLSWDRWCGLLEIFRGKYGHCNVPTNFKLKGLRLGKWANKQRANKGLLSKNRISRLDALGFSWDQKSELWNAAFSALKKFIDRNGHSTIPKNAVSKGINLRTWSISQRFRKNRLTLDQIKRLDSIGFSWDPANDFWDSAFSALREFKEQEGHCKVPRKFSINGINLGNWVNSLRQKKEDLTADKIRRLNSINFNWDPHAEKWEISFSALKKFYEKEGHCSVPKHLFANGVKLQSWASMQRLRKERLSPDQVKRLNSLGFSWDPNKEQWNSSFAKLESFQKREGHCRVIQDHTEDGFKLGKWVSKQRQKRSTLSPERIKRLNALGFIWNP